MKQESLFDIPETLSPRAAWMREHHVSVIELDETQPLWEAVGNYARTATGGTEDEALVAFATKYGLKGWWE